ncbi:MAG: flagellin N-terminal helical domain-containing protein [Burkholderiales bacterium]
MPTTINTNIMSLNAQLNLQTSQNSLATSLERLSSGLQINTAADNAAGFAITQQMTAQINGINQAAQNANDGISMAQTAQGGLNAEIGLLQSMRTLAVQAANGTNSASDRQAIQAQIAQLQQELSRTALSTQFNGQNILDGTMSDAQFQVGANAGQTINFGIANTQGSAIGNNAYSTGGAMTGAIASTSSTASGNGVTAQNLTVQGSLGSATVAIGANDSAFTIAANVNNVSASTGVSATALTQAEMTGLASGGTISFGLTGSNGTAVTINASVTSTSDLSSIANAINADTASTGISAYADQSGHLFMTQSQGYDVKITNLTDSSIASGSTTVASFQNFGTGADATSVGVQSGGSVTVGGQVSFESASAYSLSSSVAGTASGGSVLNTTSAAGATVGSSLNNVSSIDVTTVANGVPTGANSAINTIDMALQSLNTIAANLGSVQNRFQDTITNLQTTSNNLSAARSRIQDTNYAQETSNLTRSQILQQAGTAMLAQANQLPNMVLTLLK